jgi:hypothetical protein
MKTLKNFKKYALVIICIFVVLIAQAQTIFETNFQATEGWVAEGIAGSTGGLIARSNIMYNGTPYTFICNQVAINPIDAAADVCSMGSANIQKNGKTTATGVSTQTTNNGYILLPDFNADIQVSIARAKSTTNDRQIVIESSADGGTSWTASADDAAPYNLTGCSVFKSPSKFAKGTRVRITNHSSQGGLKIYWLKVEAFSADVTPPTVTSRTPDINSVEITPSIRSISLTFSEPIKAGGDGKCYVVGNTSGNVLELTSDGLTYNVNTVTIPFSTTFFLNPNETYTVLLEKGCIKDMANNPADEITWNFTTKVSVSSAKNILSIKIPKMVGAAVIDSVAGTINLQLVAGSDLHNIQPANITFTVSPLATILNDYKDFGAGPQTYVVTAEDKSTKNWVVTITLAQFKVATLPVVYLGSATNTWQNIVEDGWTNLVVNADVNTKINTYSFYQASLTQATHFFENNFAGGANRVSFRARYGNSTSNYKVDVQESPDGTTWTSVVSYIPSNLLFAADNITVTQPTTLIPDPTPMLPTSGSTIGLRSYPVQTASKFLRWIYTTRTNTSFYIDDVIIENAPANTTAPTFLSDQPVVSQNYSTNTKSQIIFKLSKTVKVTQDLISKINNPGIHVTATGMDSVLYEPKILTLRTGEVVLTDMPALIDQKTYTVTVPSNTFVDLDGNAFAGTSFTFTYVASTGINNNNINMVVVVRQGENLIVDGGKSIQIYNTMGSLLRSSTRNFISVGNLQKGVYLIRYQTENGSTGTTKILLNN